MPIVIVRARYVDQNNLERFLTKLFGNGKSEVHWKRGRYLCNVPRDMTEDETQQLQEALQEEHYDGK